MNNLRKLTIPPQVQSPMRRCGMTWALRTCLSVPHQEVFSKPLNELSPNGIELVFQRLADTGNAVPSEALVTAPKALHHKIMAAYLGTAMISPVYLAFPVLVR